MGYTSLKGVTISVVIPTHNRDRLLKRAILSILNQTYNKIEIIVVDDASICDNKKILDNFDSRIIYHRFETQQGANICRNKGVELASGQYIAFLDDDDVWREDKLHEQLRFMIKNDIDLSYTGKYIFTIGENQRIINRRYSFTWPKSQNFKKEIMRKNFIGTTSSILVKKDKFLEVGGFDPNMPAIEDYDFYIRFIFAGFTVRGIDKGLVYYYVYKENTSLSRNLKKNFQAAKKLLFKHRKKEYSNLLLYSISQIIFKKTLQSLKVFNY